MKLKTIIPILEGKISEHIRSYRGFWRAEYGLGGSTPDIGYASGKFCGNGRAHKRYAAGIRTFNLVCLGSALATMIGLYLGEISALGADVGRIPAQILCGIGFLGQELS